LTPGDNELRITVVHANNPDIKQDGSCAVSMNEPFDVSAEPEGLQSVGLSQTSGRKVARVMINDKQVSGSGPWTGTVQFSLWGPTTFTVRAEFENGCSEVLKKDYDQNPEDGRIYEFDFGGDVGRVELAYFAGKDSYRSFWYTTGDAWRELIKRCPSVRERAAGGVAFEEALAVAAWLNEQLRAGGWLGPDQVFGLPTDSDMNALLQQLLPAIGDGIRREWLRNDEDEGGDREQSTAPYAEISAAGLAVRYTSRIDALGFRIIAFR
jgi:hypothetical protein